MTAEEQTISLFETRVRELILSYSELKDVRADLERKIKERDEQISQLKSEMEQLKSEYETLKTARIVSASGSDIENVKKEVNKMIRTIDRCVAILGSDL